MPENPAIPGMPNIPDAPVNLGGALQPTPTYPIGAGGGGLGSKGDLSADEMWQQMLSKTDDFKGAGPIPFSSIYLGKRYNTSLPYADTEEMAAQQQSSPDKFGNGVAKMAGTALTTFLSGIVGTVHGIGAALFEGRFAALYDNSTNRYLDSLNKEMEDALPNYYTHQEQDANWYSSDRLLTANFFSDKIIKNLGFSIGAMAGGVAWGSLIKAVGMTNALIRGGEALKTASVVDGIMTNGDKLGKFGQIYNRLTSLSGKVLNTAGKVLSTSDRTTISVMGTLGEAAIESLSNMNEFRNELISDYKKEYGVDPTGAALEEINQYADKVGNFTWGGNVALLSATNYIQLPKILGSSRKAEKAMINDIKKEASGKFVQEAGTLEKVFGKTGRLTDKYLVKPASLFFSVPEAFEEGSQFAVQVGVESYFDSAFKNKKEVGNFFSDLNGVMGGIMSEGVPAALTTTEGIENILIGGLSGGLQTSFSPVGDNTVKERGLFGTGGTRAVNTATALKALNEGKKISDILKDRVKYAAIGLNSQISRQEAIDKDDKLSEKNYEQDYLLSYIMPRAKYGQLDSVKQELGYYRKQAVSNEGWADLQSEGVALPNETREQFLKRIDNIERTADKVGATYDMLNDKFAGVVDKDNKRVYSDTVIEKMVYAAAKVVDYDQRLSELGSSLQARGLDSSLIREALYQAATIQESKAEVPRSESLGTALAEVAATIDDREDISDVDKDSLKEDLLDYLEMGLQRKTYMEDYNAIKKAPKEFDTKPAPVVTEEVKVEETKTASKTVKIKTQAGEQEYEIGEEYLIGSPLKESKEGLPFYQYGRFTFIGEDKDGKILVKDNSTGIVHSADKDYYEKYKIEKVSSLAIKPNGLFYTEIAGKIFTYYVGKNKKPEKGHIIYKKDKDRLVFQTLDGKRTYPVTRNQFVAKEGFNQAQITATNEKLSPAAEAALAKEVTKEEVAEKYANRNEVINELVTESKKSLDEINTKLEAAKNELAAAKESLTNLTTTKKGLPKKRFDKAAKKTIEQLSKTKDNLEKTIANLEQDKTDLEATLPYLQDMLESKDELPEGFDDVVAAIKQDINDIKEIIEHTEDAIKQGKGLLATVEELLLSALSVFNDFIRRLKEENPNVPLSIEEFQGRLERYMGEGGAQQFIDERLGYTQNVLDLQDSISDFRDELKVPDMDKKAEKLSADISELEKGLATMRVELAAKAKILSKFENLVIEYEKRKEEEKAFVKNQALVAAVIGTMVNNQQSFDNESNWEPEAKKTDILVVTSTTVPSEEFSKEPLAEHHKRANRFGVKMPTLSNADKIRGVVVTANNQDKVIKGLVEFLKGTSTIDPSKTIALVMVDENGVPVDEDGKTIDNPEDYLSKGIFQVFPATLSWSNGKSMFRSDTSKDAVKALTEQYDKWRADALSSQDVVIQKVMPSFGVPQVETQLNDKGIAVPTGEQNSVEESGLMSDDILEKEPVLMIGKNDIEKHGTSTFNKAKGKIFLKLANGLVKLNNKRLGKVKAEAIYETLLRLSALAIEDKMSSLEAKRLLKWLSSVVYWGFPANQAGQNSIWFERDNEEGLVLNLSRKGEQRTFTPTALKQDKQQLITIISAMYSNVNSSRVSQATTQGQTGWDEKYEEILSVKEDGTIESKIWPNYQTYLLSSKDRKVDEIPLTTSVRKKKNVEDVNREGVYFVLVDNEDKFTVPVSKPSQAFKPLSPIAPTATAAAPTADVKNAAEDSKESSLGDTGLPPVIADGSFTNVGQIKSGKIYYFLATPEGTEKLISGTELEAAIKDVMESSKVSRQDAINMIRVNARNRISSAASIISTPVQKPDAPVTGNATLEVAEEGETFTMSSFTKPGEGSVQAVEEIPADVQAILNSISKPPVDDEFRKAIIEEATRFETENWNKAEKWLKANFPNLPIFRVKNIIQATNGAQAWGMLHKGAIYLYENAEVGTLYHEVFEAVWKMFSDPKEKAAIMQEFLSRKGSFIDRPTGQTVLYSQATPYQIKEQLAEEFRAFILSKEKKSPKGFLGRLFKDIVTFIKEFFTSKNAGKNTNELFKRIGSGYYKSFIPKEQQLSFAKKGIIDIENAYGDNSSEYSIANIPSNNVNDIMQQMTYDFVVQVFKDDNKNLFDIEGITRGEIYKNLQTKIFETILSPLKVLDQALTNKKITEQQYKVASKKHIALYNDVKNNWEAIKKKHAEYLRVYSIEFDDNDNVQLTDEDNSGKEDYKDATKIDNFKKTSSALKILLATLPLMRENGSLVTSAIGGVSLMPLSKVFITIMNKTHTSRSIDEMLERIRQMAVQEPSYRRLYNRITKSDYKKEGVDLSNLDQIEDLELLSNFFKSFKKQNAAVKNVVIFENGDVQVSDSNLGTAARQLASLYENALVKAIKNSIYFKYNDTEKYYENTNKIAEMNLSTDEAKLLLLKNLDIFFDEKDFKKLSENQKTTFREVVNGIQKSLSSVDQVRAINKKVLDIQGRLLQLGELKAAIENPEFDSTYFNVNNERVQAFLGVNWSSILYDELSQIEKLSDLDGTIFSYILTDPFARNSAMIKKMFTSKGDRKKLTTNFMQPGYADGTINMARNKKKESSKQNIIERLTQEFNLNLAGFYYTLVPGDASMEHFINMGNHVSYKDFRTGNPDIIEIFKGYFISELETARDKSRRIEKIGSREKTDLRFLKPILDAYDPALHTKIIKKSGTLEEVYEAFKDDITRAVDKFLISETNATLEVMGQYGMYEINELGTYSSDNIAFENNQDMPMEVLQAQVWALTANFVINNIEQHKLIFSDPYLYKDELKRIKNFSSPRQALVHDSPVFNSAINRVYNKNYSSTEDLGYTDMNKDYFETVVFDDILSQNELEGFEEPYEETDGGGIITFKARRVMEIRASNWSTEKEKAYRLDVAYEKSIEGIPMSPEEVALLEEDKVNPIIVPSALSTLKPIVAGRKQNDENYNDIMLDKYALYTLSYRTLHKMNPNSNLLKLYKKMQREGIDYGVFNTGRKVGVVESNEMYDNEGVISSVPFKGMTNVPFSIMAIQTDVPTKDVAMVSRGTQVTKLATLDLMQMGIPVDFLKGKDFEEAYEEWVGKTEEERLAWTDNGRPGLYSIMKKNQDLLEQMTEEGFNTLLKKLGIQSVSGKFIITDRDKTASLLREEMMKREVNDNIISALDGFLNGDVIIESTPAYQQVRNILYSIIDKNVISPKISGSSLVQIPSSFFEDKRIEITKDKKGKPVYQSDILKFYKNKDGERVCEVYLARWFDTTMTDEELLDYLNNTEEGKKMLRGVGFRIPTQRQNSIDSFVIKGFLPKGFGGNIVVPSALVRKAGSDFDIDKLFVYLKNIISVDRKLIPLPSFSTKEENMAALENIYYDNIVQGRIDKANAKLLSDSNLRTLFSDLYLGKASNKTSEKWIPIFKKIFSDYVDGDKLNVRDVEEAFYQRLLSTQKNLDKLTDYDVQQALFEEFAEKNYKKILENQYIETLEDLISHPENFTNLTTPNSAEQLKGIAKKINKLLGIPEINYSATDNLISRLFMSSLRQAFVRGKYAIGIAARNQTQYSLNQRSKVVVDLGKIAALPKTEKFWVGDGTINLPHNTTKYNGEITASLSFIKNVAGQNISDIISQFIDGYVDIAKGPWIMQLGATPNVAATWLFLIQAGVPVEQVAYFMNQPVIKEYLLRLEKKGYTYLFIDKYVGELLGDISIDTKDLLEQAKASPLPESLESMVGKKLSSLSTEESIEQGKVLLEFLKYSKLSSYYFDMAQGTNYDTANMNDPFLVFKKKYLYEKAKLSPITSVDDVLENSFLKILQQFILDSRDAVAEILVSDKGNVRKILEQVLTPYVEMPDKEFVKFARKIVSDLFDWAVQTNEGYNKALYNTLVKDGGAVDRLERFVQSVKKDSSHPLYNNTAINSLEFMESRKRGGPKNIKIKNRDNKIYDQNQLIGAFTEIKKFLGEKDKQIYFDLVGAAFLQSGLTNSPIAFTSLLPYEDFKEIYESTLANLENIPNLSSFADLKVIERTNWNDDDIISFDKAGWTKGKKYNPSMKYLPFKLKDHIAEGIVPHVMTKSISSYGSGKDFIVYSWENWDDYTKEQRAKMKQKGDWSFMNKGLFQKVYIAPGVPLLSESNGREYFIYKMINAWGDSYRAKEFYSEVKSSVLENGMLKTIEVADDVIVPYFLAPEAVERNPTYDILGGEMQKKPEIDRAPTTFLPYDGGMMSEQDIVNQMPANIADEISAALGYDIKTGPPKPIEKQGTTPNSLSDEQIMNSATYKAWLKGNENPFMNDQEMLEYYKTCNL